LTRTQRANDELREIVIRKNFLKYADGSCLIEVGNTKVICTASVEEKVPPFLKGENTGWITAEYSMLPASAATSRMPRESSAGKVGGRTQEIQRFIGRSIRSVVNLELLGEKTIWLDCDVIQADGGTRTAAITGAFIALCLCLKKMEEQDLIERSPVKDFLAATSVGIVEGEPLLDLAYFEDAKAEVDMNVVMTGRGDFVEIQGSAEKKPFSQETLETLLLLARKGIMELISRQKEILKGIL
jgi:ribonuclease PH